MRGDEFRRSSDSAAVEKKMFCLVFTKSPCRTVNAVLFRHSQRRGRTQEMGTVINSLLSLSMWLET